MIETILSTLKIMGWLGIVLGILVIVNITTSALYNTWSNQENFCRKKLLKGFVKALIFYLSAVALSIAFAILPYINIMISDTFDVLLIANETLDTLSSIGVLGTVIAAIVTQGKKAITSIAKFSEINTSTKESEIKKEIEE